ncbi:MAG: amidohydrolase, partial [Ramlibacter sp.]|nr:amidohydrolase [Ramlibacter sp.]
MTPDGGEDVVLPDLAVVDAHHHLWLRDGHRYLADELAADLASGHRIEATVYAECSSMYRRHGPEELRCVGEAEFVAGVAAMSDSGLFGEPRMCAAFVGGADLAQGAEVDRVLDALAVASGGRLRGIRAAVPWDPDPAINPGGHAPAPQGQLRGARFREGVERLSVRGLVLDVWLYHPQLPEL